MISSTVLSQSQETKWTTEYGLSKNTRYPNFKGINVRFISPLFPITTAGRYWTEEEEKHPEKFKKTRFFIELLYAPPFDLPKEVNTDVARIAIPGLFKVFKGKFDSLFYYVRNNIRLSELVASFNLQHKIVEYKIWSLQATVGFKFFFLMNPENGLINFNKMFYLNLGLLSQLDLGMFLPFVDIGFDQIYTIGTELKLHTLFRKEGRRYRLHLK
jgi:hypothetical protein